MVVVILVVLTVVTRIGVAVLDNVHDVVDVSSLEQVVHEVVVSAAVHYDEIGVLDGEAVARGRFVIVRIDGGGDR